MDAPPPRGQPALHPLAARDIPLASLLASLPGAVMIADRDGRVVEVNPAFRSLCHVSADQPRLTSWISLVHPDDRVRIETGWLEAVAAGVSWEAEFRCATPDGVAQWLSTRTAPLRDAEGRAIAHVGSFENVTLRTRLNAKVSALIEASAQLLESPRLDAVLPATMRIAQNLIAADGYALWRLQGRANWAIVAASGISEAFATAVIEQYEGEAVTTVPFSAPLGVDDLRAATWLADRQAMYAAEGLRSMLVVPLRIRGTLSGSLVFYYRTPQRFDDIRVRMSGALGNLAAVAISTAELHEEQLRQQAQVERAHQQSAFLADASVALGSSLDYEATLKTVAQLAVPRIADWCAVDVLDSRGELKRLAVAHVDPTKVEFARTLRERYPEDPSSPNSIHQVIRGGRPMMMSSIGDEMLVAAARDEEHLRILRELGLTSYIAVPLVANGRTLGALTFVTAESGRHYQDEDVAFAQAVAERAALAVDNARAYSEAHAASRAKDDFLATLSHELRTPVNAIMGWGQMLQHGMVDASRTQRAVEAIVRNAAAQARLIEDLLDLSRITTGSLRLDVEVVDVAAVVSAAVATVEPAAEAKGIRIQSMLDRGGRVYGDRQRLQQIAWNLLSNAVKFTARGGRVLVQVLRVNSHVEVVVSDDGQGIAAELLPYVFDRFRQGDSSSTRPYAGLGLGLAIVRQLVELHGGTVEASSGGPGSGATFRVKLPLSVARDVASGAGTSSAAHPAVPTITTGSLAVDGLPDLTGTRVLIVEDQADAGEMVAYLLRQRNAEVAVVTSCDEALAEIQRQVPDVLLSDVEMPGCDGYSLVRAVRELPVEAGGMIPAAALTAYSRPEDRARSMLAGFDAHLAKPVDLAELIATVMRLARRGPAEARSGRA